MKLSSCTSLVSSLLSWEVPGHSRSGAPSHSAGTCTVARACSNALPIAVSVDDACGVDGTEQDGDFMNRPTRKTRCQSTLKTFRACIAVSILLGSVAVVAPAAQARVSHRESSVAPRFKAIAFDYFVLFNPDSVVPGVERVFPGKGREFTNLWRTRQFEYTWLRSITDRYVDFFDVTEDALIYAARAMTLELTPDNKRRLLDAYLHLTPWPDAVDALRRLKASGIRIITIANFSPTMLRSNAENAGLTGFFDDLVSTDANHTYKPDPRAYRLGMDRLHLAKEDILFAAFGGWDAAGAKSFGYPTFWVNRFNQPFEELGVRPDQTSTNLDGLLNFVLSEPPAQKR
jgi:2-haloacid dehalogenase